MAQRTTAVSDVSTRRLLGLAASAFVVLAAEPSYLLVDTAVVGHLGAEALGGLGIAAALVSVLLLAGSFVEYGTTGRAARWFGLGRRAEAVNEGVQASWLAVVIGLVLVVVGEVVAGPVARLVAGGNTAAGAAAVAWLRVGLLGLPGVLLILAGNGWMRGVQRTRQPVVIVVAANVISAVASPVLVYPLGMGLRGSAVANLAAQTVGGLLFLRALAREGVPLRPQWQVVASQLRVGRDLALRSVGFQVAFLTAAGAASRMGSAQLAAHQIGLQLWTFLALLLDSLAIAAQSLVGAALGGGSQSSARRMAWQVARYGAVAGTVAAAALTPGVLVIPALFTTDPAVVHQAHVLWPWLVVMLPAAGVVFALDGVLIGAGDVAFLRTVTLVGALAVFAPLNLAALHWQWGLTGVWAGLTGFVLVRFLGGLRRIRGQAWMRLGAQA